MKYAVATTVGIFLLFLVAVLNTLIPMLTGRILEVLP